MTSREVRAFLAASDLRAIRRACGFREATVAAAVGVFRERVRDWETRRCYPRGGAGQRYARVVAGMVRHLEVSEALAGEADRLEAS